MCSVKLGGEAKRHISRDCSCFECLMTLPLMFQALERRRRRLRTQALRRHTLTRGRAQWHVPRWLQRPNAQITSYITAYANTETHRLSTANALAWVSAHTVLSGWVWDRFSELSLPRGLFSSRATTRKVILSPDSFLSYANLISSHPITLIIPSLKHRGTD